MEDKLNVKNDPHETMYGLVVVAVCLGLFIGVLVYQNIVAKTGCRFNGGEIICVDRQ